MLPAPPKQRCDLRPPAEPGPLVAVRLLKNEDTAFVVATDESGSRVVWSGTHDECRAAYLDLVVELSQARPDAYIGIDGWLESHLRGAKVDLGDRVGVEHYLLPTYRRAAINDPGVSERVRDRFAKTIVVATDASCSTSAVGKVTAWAVVTETGQHRAGTVPVRNILRGELEAIHQATKLQRSKNLVVLTDSMNSIHALRRYLTEGVRASGIDLSWVDRIEPARRIEVRWVRSHNGHPMNECVDRLALAARRSAELGVDNAARKAVLENIVAEMLPFEFDVDALDPETSVRLGGEPAHAR